MVGSLVSLLRSHCIEVNAGKVEEGSTVVVGEVHFALKEGSAGLTKYPKSRSRTYLVVDGICIIESSMDHILYRVERVQYPLGCIQILSRSI